MIKLYHTHLIRNYHQEWFHAKWDADAEGIPYSHVWYKGF